MPIVQQFLKVSKNLPPIVRCCRQLIEVFDQPLRVPDTDFVTISVFVFFVYLYVVTVLTFLYLDAVCVTLSNPAAATSPSKCSWWSPNRALFGKACCN